MQYRETDPKTLAAYESHIEERQRAEINAVAEEHADTRMGHINSTASGGGVAEILVSVVPLLNDVGVETEWRVMEAPEEFFEVTKTIHNGLQGGRDPLTDDMRETYHTVTEDNAEALEAEYDVLVLHDPQSLGMAPILADRFPETALVWRCHIDLTDGGEEYIEFVQSFLDPVDRAIFTLPEYGEAITGVERDTIYPSIDPLTEKNRPVGELTGEAADAADFSTFPFDPDRPLLLQVSRFDPWKDPVGVIEAYRTVSESIPEAQLALVGAMPDDDPEGIEVYEKVEAEAGDDPDIHLLTNLPDAGINGLQWGADVVLQKSLREGFALTVSEALWKETPVVGTDVGGIPLQVDDGENGFLVGPRDIDAAAERIVRLLDDDGMRERFGEAGRETVREEFLTPRQVLDYLTLLSDAADGAE